MKLPIYAIRELRNDGSWLVLKRSSDFATIHTFHARINEINPAGVFQIIEIHQPTWKH